MYWLIEKPESDQSEHHIHSMHEKKLIQLLVCSYFKKKLKNKH